MTQLQIDDDQILRRYVKHASPFGPIDAGIIDSAQHSVLRELFDPHNKIYSALQGDPSLIIGRRGSGKTAYLQSMFLDGQYSIVQEIRTADTFSRIVSAIEKGSGASYLTENVADLWEKLFYFALMAEVARKYKGDNSSLRRLQKFVSHEAADGHTSVDLLLWSVVKKLLHDVPGAGLLDALSGITDVWRKVTGVSFEEARRLVLGLLEEKDERAILLLDSLEQYPTAIPNVANTLAGLLYCVGRFNQRHERFKVRLCLPAEIYHAFTALSSAPLKDLSSSITLHWIARELVNVASHRLQVYLRLYFPDRVRKAKAPALHEYLPERITNGLGGTEDTLAYILRHTQLQPRHLLMYLNAIFGRQRQIGEAFYPKITEEAVRQGIAQIEHRLCQEVFSAYYMRYPAAQQICEACIPELSLRFTWGQLEKVFNRVGKKAYGGRDVGDFRRLLMELGIVGRVMRETERYVIGRFEYIEPFKVSASTDDDLCLHPVFAQVFHFKNRGATKAVYPFGSDPQDQDHRDWLAPETIS